MSTRRRAAQYVLPVNNKLLISPLKRNIFKNPFFLLCENTKPNFKCVPIVFKIQRSVSQCPVVFGFYLYRFEISYLLLSNRIVLSVYRPIAAVIIINYYYYFYLCYYVTKCKTRLDWVVTSHDCDRKPNGQRSFYTVYTLQ